MIFTGFFRVLIGSAVLAASSNLLCAEDWNRFRGPNGTGIAKSLKLADGLTDASLRWKKELPAGTSSPIVIDGKIYLTSFDKDQRTVHCFKASNGESLWACSVDKARVEAATPPNGPATSGLACDGQRIVAFFPDAGVVSVSMDGQKQWLKDLGPFSSMHGLCASPLLHDGTVVLAVDQLTEPYIIALDAASGNEKWRTSRLLGITGGYSTPALMELAGKTYIISAAPGELIAYDIQTGDKRATIEGLANAPVSTPVVVGNRVYYNEPPGEPIPMAALGPADKNKDGVIEIAEVANSIAARRLIERIDLGFGDNNGAVDQAEWDKAFGTFLNRGGFSCIEFKQNGPELESQVVWKFTKSTPYIPSALVLDDVAYLVNDGGILMSFDGGSGEMLQRARLGEATGQYYASPIAGGNKLVLTSRDGKITIVQAGRPFEIKNTYSIDEQIVATPSIDNGLLYVRSEGFLYCFGDS
jgi:outer membrane protein assembly factor BamB